jgi:hypothetical protein
MHWLRPYDIAYVIEGGAAVEDLEGRIEGRISEWDQLKLYYDN